MKSLFWNIDERRMRAFFRVVIFLVLAAILVNPTIIFLKAVNKPLLTQTTLNVIVAVGFLISLLVVSKYIDKCSLKDFGLSLNGYSFLSLFYGILLGGLLLTACTLPLMTFGTISLESTFFLSGDSDPIFAVAFMTQMLRYLAGSLFEELMTRAYMIKNLAEGIRNSKFFSDSRSIWAAAIFTSVFFGLTHLFNDHSSGIAALNISLLGMVFAMSYIYTGNLFWPIGLHMGWNVFQNNLLGLPNSGKPSEISFLVFSQEGSDLWTGGEFGMEASILTTLVLTVALIGTWLNFRRATFKLKLF